VLRWASTRIVHTTERILIVGPGDTDPVENIHSICPASEIVLVEVEGRLVHQLETRYRGIDALRIIKGDVSLLSDLAPGPYDLTIIRHPDVARFNERWAAALDSSVAALRQGGLLMVTCYSLPEMAFINKVLHEKPVSLHAGSPYTTVPVDLQGNDRYILIFEKQSG